MASGKYITPAEDRFIRLHAELRDMTIGQVARELNRNYGAVCNYCKRHGIRFLHANRERWHGEEIIDFKGDNQYPVTDLTESLICKCVADGIDYEHIRIMTGRPINLIKEIIGRCMLNGKYDLVKNGEYVADVDEEFEE